MSSIIITEEQLLQVINRLFNSLYGKVRYKTQKYRQSQQVRRLSVYTSDSLRRMQRGSIKTTYILEYYPHDGSIWISDKVFHAMKKFFPPLSNSPFLLFDFFKDWFKKKFDITPKKVNIVNEKTLNNTYNSQS